MGSGRPDPGSAPVGPALTGLSLAAVGTPAKTHLSWGCPPQTIHQLRKPESRLSLDYRAVLHLPQEGCWRSVSSWSAWVPEQSSCLITPRQSACLTCTRPSFAPQHRRKMPQFANLRLITLPFINCCLQSASSQVYRNLAAPSESLRQPAKMTMNLSGKETASEMKWGSLSALPSWEKVELRVLISLWRRRQAWSDNAPATALSRGTRGFEFLIPGLTPAAQPSMSKSLLHGTDPSKHIPGSQDKKGKKPVPCFSLFAYRCMFGPEDRSRGISPKGHKKIIIIQRCINQV